MRTDLDFLLVVVMGMALSGACSKDPDPAPRDAVPEPEADVASVSTPALADALAEVNGIPVNRDEFLRHVEPYPDRMKENLRGREYVLRALVDQILLEAEARRRGLDRDPGFVRKVESYRRNLLNNMLFERIRTEGFEVTDAEARAYFDAHPDEFDRPARVQVRHILVATEAEARELLVRARKGDPFEQLARDHSKDNSTRERGGDMGVFSASQRPELAPAAFALKKPGDLSGAVQTRRGYHLLQLVRRIPPEKKTFEQARETLTTRLRARKRQDTKDQLLEELRAGAKIKIHTDRLESVQIPAEPTD